MAGEWRTTSLAELCDSIDYGYTASAKEYPVGPKLLRITDIVSDGINWDSVPFCEIDESLIEKYLLRKGDVVIARTGATTGYSTFLTEPPYAVFASYLVRLKINRANNSRFIAYFLKSPRFWAYMRGILGDKSAQPNASAAMMVKVALEVPPLKEQQAIACILGALDDKIEVNRRMNKTLEEMARAIFKSWFVNFDPVRAKAEGRDTGLPKKIADLFPDSFQDSELGQIPKGWKVETLADFAALNSENLSKETRPEVIKYIDLSNTKWGIIDVVTHYAQQDAPSRAQRVLRPGDTIVGTVRPGNGSYAFISEAGLTGSTGFAVLRPRRPEDVQFVYMGATASENIDRLSHLADGGAYPAVRPEVVVEKEMIKPGDKVLVRFSMITDPILSKMAQNQHQSRTLAEIRDALLPKLISGELRVPDAERIVGRCV